jgi:hypothetical protein
VLYRCERLGVVLVIIDMVGFGCFLCRVSFGGVVCRGFLEVVWCDAMRCDAIWLKLDSTWITGRGKVFLVVVARAIHEK